MFVQGLWLLQLQGILRRKIDAHKLKEQRKRPQNDPKYKVPWFKGEPTRL